MLRLFGGRSQPTAPEQNWTQAQNQDCDQQAQISPDGCRIPTHIPPAVQPEVPPVNQATGNQVFSNCQLGQQRRNNARRAADTENTGNNPTPPNIVLDPQDPPPNPQAPANVNNNFNNNVDNADLPPGNDDARDIDEVGQQPAGEQPLPPTQLNEAEAAHAAAKVKQNRVVDRLSCSLPHSLGPMNVRCPKCQAWHWDAERLKSHRDIILFGSCCLSGQIVLPPPKCPPRELWELFTGRHLLSDNFQKNIRALNAALAFTSFGATNIGKIPAGQGPYIFKIGGEVHHQSGMLDRVPKGQQPQYAQLYLYDPQDAANFRTQNPHNSNIDCGLMRLLTGVIHESHGYAALYKQAWQRMQAGPVQILSIVLWQQRNTDPRRYNLPTNDEIALILPDNALNQQRDIVLFKQDGGFQRMDSWNPAYACLHYVLLFPKGEHGFQRHIPLQGQQWQQGLHPQAAHCAVQLDAQVHEPDEEDEEDEGDAPSGNQQRKRTVVSERQYYAYYLFSHEEPDVQLHYPGADGIFSTIFWAGRLFQQYLVDIWAIADQSKLLWLWNNQSSLQVELYSGLCDALLTDNLTRGEQVGRYILPSSYYGGQRQMAESYQDAMAISCFLGGPQLFITMTANPKWPEIQQALLPGQTHLD
ncbi:Isoleucine--tRNA ligase [Rhizoctonia solani]|uniref:Isoleucine--tRNA ligase n=1 Tax=Rhizoctonia solani TaxID=456999 RepID=A0A0K6FTW3_9AGAM|nr:Isoleucine--tRNA ligase [Rhizoctonia solani]